MCKKSLGMLAVCCSMEGHARGHETTFLCTERGARGHFTTFCPMERHTKGHFTTFCPLQGHPRRLFILLYLTQGHPRGHHWQTLEVCQWLETCLIATTQLLSSCRSSTESSLVHLVSFREQNKVSDESGGSEVCPVGTDEASMIIQLSSTSDIHTKFLHFRGHCIS